MTMMRLGITVCKIRIHARLRFCHGLISRIWRIYNLATIWWIRQFNKDLHATIWSRILMSISWIFWLDTGLCIINIHWAQYVDFPFMTLLSQIQWNLMTSKLEVKKMRVVCYSIIIYWWWAKLFSRIYNKTIRNNRESWWNVKGQSG